MLSELDIRNVGPIRSASLAPAQGMTAITGETGAGKSMLLSAIRMISGAATESSRVTPGADELWAQAIVEVDEERNAAAIAAARDAGIEPEDGEFFLTRSVPAQGRSRTLINGTAVPRSTLAAVAGELVTIHGQADQLRIASAAKQRDFLDMVAGDDGELAAYREAWHALEAMDERLEKLRTQESSSRQQADYLRESIDRINQIDPQAGEDAELLEKRDRIENAAEISQGISGALIALDSTQLTDVGEGVSAAGLLARAAQSLRSIRANGSLSEYADRLDSIEADINDVVFALSQELDGDVNEGDLDRINGRIHDLNELTRRWGPELSDVIAWRDQAVFDLEDLDASPEKLSELQAQREELFAKALEAAKALSKAREQAAKTLSEGVTRELDSLAMSGAALHVSVTPSEALGAYGADDIAFLFTPFPGSGELPMGKAASGGELSRLMLALELVAAERRTSGSAGMTFIFDEVDAGVGGKSAAELGKRLAKLAKSSQVIVVTHLAQVASWADAQYVVQKSEAGQTTVVQVDGENREREIARMLSGSESDTSLEHARELLSSSTLNV